MDLRKNILLASLLLMLFYSSSFSQKYFHICLNRSFVNTDFFILSIVDYNDSCSIDTVLNERMLNTNSEAGLDKYKVRIPQKRSTTLKVYVDGAVLGSLALDHINKRTQLELKIINEYDTQSKRQDYYLAYRVFRSRKSSYY
jgi:hypothetical protein